MASASRRERGYLYRSAPLPPELRRVAVEAAVEVYEPEQLGAALGDLLSTPPDRRHQPHPPHGLAATAALGAPRPARQGQGLDFDEAFGGEDRLTQAVTLFALLELYRRGEATWSQKEPFGPIEVKGAQ